MKPVYAVRANILCADCGAGYGDTGPLVKVTETVFPYVHDVNLCRECLDLRIEELSKANIPDDSEEITLKLPDGQCYLLSSALESLLACEDEVDNIFYDDIKAIHKTLHNQWLDQSAQAREKMRRIE